MAGYSLSEIVIIINLSCILTLVLLNLILLIGNYKLCIKNKYLPLVFGIVKNIKESTIRKQKVYKTVKYLNVCKDSVTYTRNYYCRKYSIVVIIFLIMNILSVAVISGTTTKNYLINNRFIVKPKYNETSKKVSLDINVHGKDSKKSNIDIEVLPNRLNSFEEGRLIAEVREYLDNKILANNKSLDRIESSINLVSTYDKDKNISITWKTDELGIIDYKGDINYKYLKKQEKFYVDITIKAVITYFENEYEHDINLRVYKKEESSYDKLLNSLQKEITKLNNKYNNKGILMLPSRLGGYTIEYDQPKDNSKTKNWLIIMMLGALCIIIVIKYKDNDFKKDITEKNEQLILSYAGIVNKIKMYVIAGLPIEQAWENICKDYLKGRDEDNVLYAYEEMLYTYKDMEVGTSCVEAFTDFGRRIGIGSYIRLSSIIVQNIKNGTQYFIDALELEVKDVEIKQREMYVKKGGELGAKLLVPMMLLMAITLVIVMLPALMTM